MKTDNVAPIGRDSTADTAEAKIDHAGYLMRQAVQAAILLLAVDDPQPLARDTRQMVADVLRLARDRWDSAQGDL
jgi:hypothetical protein